MKTQLNGAHSVGFWQARHEEHCPSIPQIQRPIVVLLFHPKEVMEVTFLPAQALHLHKVEGEGSSRQDSYFHSSFGLRTTTGRWICLSTQHLHRQRVPFHTSSMWSVSWDIRMSR